jgi:hypothetical protein
MEAGKAHDEERRRRGYRGLRSIPACWPEWDLSYVGKSAGKDAGRLEREIKRAESK